MIVEGKEEQGFLEPLPLSLLPLARTGTPSSKGSGCAGSASWRRFRAAPSRSGWGRRGSGRGASQGGERTRSRVRGRSPAAELAEALSFPEAVANELTLRRAFGALLDRLLARPERAGRPLRKVAVSARLVGGGSWRRATTLREATAERGRLRAALGPKLLEIPPR